MSRNLYTIATVVQPVVDGLKELRNNNPQAWWNGAGEELLRQRMVSPEPLVASYRVVLDGWGMAMEDLVQLVGDGAPAWLPVFANEVIAKGLGVCKPTSVTKLRRTQKVKPPLNSYAVVALQDALENGARFAAATGCSLVGLKRTLNASFDDGDFR